MTENESVVRIWRQAGSELGDPGVWWVARWRCGREGSSRQAQDRELVLAWARDQEADTKLIQDPDTGEWSPWTPETDG
ncbi:hypothetical protein [Actinopolymorpha pittospori]|uniref:Uncharacterized protein n=1 Tax=Actinopolymorpha pittospori TaxID=648752 RepID=A0A927MS15_9ACTN|nr:hypothetical protein [Actinopolymorpha pittospori]MBE1604178.1 hypothetical protein [Actinopolymorpha pittospori]